MKKSKLLEIFKWEDVEYASGIKRVETLLVQSIIEIVKEESEPIQYYKVYKSDNMISVSFEKFHSPEVGLKFRYSEDSDQIAFEEYLDDKTISARKVAIEALKLTNWVSADSIWTAQWKLLLKSILNDYYDAYEG